MAASTPRWCGRLGGSGILAARDWQLDDSLAVRLMRLEQARTALGGLGCSGQLVRLVSLGHSDGLRGSASSGSSCGSAGLASSRSDRGNEPPCLVPPPSWIVNVASLQHPVWQPSWLLLPRRKVEVAADG